MRRQQAGDGAALQRLAALLGASLLAAHVALILGPDARLLAPQLAAFHEQALIASTLGRPAAYDDEWTALLRLADDVIPPTSDVLLVSRSEDMFARYRASYALYPRAVWWPEPRASVNLPDMLPSVGLTYALVDGMPPEQLAWSALGRIWWFDPVRLRYVVEVGPP